MRYWLAAVVAFLALRLAVRLVFEPAAPALAATAVASLVAIMLMVRGPRCRFAVAGDRVEVRSWRGVRSFSLADVARVRPLTIRNSRFLPMPRILVLGRGGRTLFALPASYDAAAVGRALGVPVQGSLTDRVGWRDADIRYPGSVRALAERLTQASLAIGLIGTVAVASLRLLAAG
jgi:hypothetical protein